MYNEEMKIEEYCLAITLAIVRQTVRFPREHGFSLRRVRMKRRMKE